MQALRGEKRTRSRYSSPAANASANATAESSNTIADGPAERPKTMLDRWVEPPLPAPRPSFADHGIERHGVVANMAPLGTRPSSKIMKSATRPEGADVGGRFVVGKRTEASSTPFEAMTPEPPADPPRPGSVSSKTDDLEQLSPKTPQPSSPEKSASNPTVEGQSFGQSVFALSQSPLHTTTTTNVTTPISTVANMSLPVAPIATPVQAAPPPMYSAPPPVPLGEDGEPLIDLDKTDKVIEDAVQLAVDRRRWPTAYALRILYDDARDSNPKVVRIIEAIYNTRATHAQVAEFRILMKEKKKEGKKDKAGEYYFNGDGSDPPPQPKFSSISTALSYGTPTRPDTGVRSMSDTQARASSIPHLSASPLKEYDIAHIAKKQKQSHFVSPYPPMPMNGLHGMFGAPLGAGAGANGTADAKPETPQENGASLDSPSQARSRSISTASSLSSIDEGILDSLASPAGKQRGERGVRSKDPDPDAAPTETLARHNLSSQPAPISAPQKNGPKTYTFSTATVVPSTSSSASASASASAPTPSSSSTHIHNHDHKHRRRHHHSRKNSKSSRGVANADANTADEDMAPIALAHPASALPIASGPKFISYKVKNLDKVRGRAHDDNDQANRLKRSAREITNSSAEALESFERYQPPPPAADVDTASEGDFADVAPSRRPAKIRLLNNRTARPRSNYDSEDLSSPTLLSFQPDLAPGSVAASRAGTPSALNRPTRRAKSGSGLRVKTSPMKKKGGGTLAGIPRASGERNSPLGNGASTNNQEENDDYCAACGGNGDLVCCDGCTRSFHFKCVDPPMVEGALTDDAWYCNQCQYRIQPVRKEVSPHSFGALLENLVSKNPSAFHLPKDIREFFEGVRTGSEGEYEDIAPPKPKNNKGYDEAPDFSRLKDAKGKAILCHACGKAASAPDRLIIPCSYCGLNWHLDCVDNPMTKEPHASRKWRCPAHIDDLMDILPTNLGPAHRYRKIKGSSPITPAWRRGTRNNGHIEIESSDDVQTGGGFYEDNKFGVVYKLPEEGIKLDFISKIKQTGGGIDRARLRQRLEIQRLEAPIPQAAPLESRSIAEQQAVLNLLALAGQNPQTQGVETLINTLLAEASPAVIALIAQGSADSMSQKEKPKLSKNDKQCLNAIMATIQSQLAVSDDDAPPAESGPAASETEDAPVQNPESVPEHIQHEPQQLLQQVPTPSEPEREPQQKLEPEAEPVGVESAPLKDPTCAPLFLVKEPLQEAVMDVDDDAEMLFPNN